MADSTWFRPRNTSDDPERILAAGHQGAGKSSAWLTIARRCYRTGSPATFWVIDTTKEVRRMLSGDRFQELDSEDGGNVTTYVATTWKDQISALNEILGIKKGVVVEGNQLWKPGDWIVVEMINNVWKSVQNYFYIDVFGVSMADFMIKRREQAQTEGKKVGKPLDQRGDWGPINALYDTFAKNLFFSTDCHIFATTASKTLGDNEKEEVLRAFGPWGKKPDGQGMLGFQCQTLLEFAIVRKEHIVKTVKDRERMWLEDTPWTSDEDVDDFAGTYLLQCARWKWGKEASKNLEAVS